MAATQQQTEAAVAGAVTAAVPWYAQLAAVAIGVGLPLLLAWLTAQRDAPTVVKDPAHDPAEDQYDRDYAAAVAAGRA